MAIGLISGEGTDSGLGAFGKQAPSVGVAGTLHTCFFVGSRPGYE